LTLAHQNDLKTFKKIKFKQKKNFFFFEFLWNAVCTAFPNSLLVAYTHNWFQILHLSIIFNKKNIFYVVTLPIQYICFIIWSCRILRITVDSFTHLLKSIGLNKIQASCGSMAMFWLGDLCFPSWSSSGM
jgi:hypothetical protein